jgi:hypothetical protein
MGGDRVARGWRPPAIATFNTAQARRQGIPRRAPRGPHRPRRSVDAREWTLRSWCERLRTNSASFLGAVSADSVSERVGRGPSDMLEFGQRCAHADVAHPYARFAFVRAVIAMNASARARKQLLLCSRRSDGDTRPS